MLEIRPSGTIALPSFAARGGGVSEADFEDLQDRVIWLTTQEGGTADQFLASADNPVLHAGMFFVWSPDQDAADSATLVVNQREAPLYRPDRTRIKRGDLLKNELHLLCYQVPARFIVVGELSKMVDRSKRVIWLTEQDGGTSTAFQATSSYPYLVSGMYFTWSPHLDCGDDATLLLNEGDPVNQDGPYPIVRPDRSPVKEGDVKQNELRLLQFLDNKFIITGDLSRVVELEERVDDINFSWINGYPGGAVSRFTTTPTGAPGTGVRIDPDWAEWDEFGPVVRFPGGADPYTEFTHDDPQRLEPGHVYEGKIAVQRRIDPEDPAGEAIEFRLQYMTYTYTGVVGGNVLIGSTVPKLLTSDGRQVYTVRIAAGAGTGILAWPAGAVFVRALVRIYGTDGVTDIEILGQWRDVTDEVLGAPSPDLTTLIAEVDALQSIGAGPRIEALEALVAGVEIARFKTRAQAVASTAAGDVPSTVDAIEVLGTTLEGDDLTKTYKRSASNPGSTDQFQDQDGSWWFYVAGGEVSKLNAEAGTDFDQVFTSRRVKDAMQYQRPIFDSISDATSVISAYASTALPEAIELRRRVSARPWIRSTWVREDTLPAEILGLNIVTRAEFVGNVGPNASVFWVLGTGLTASGGFVNAAPSGAERVAQNHSLLMTPGETYKITFTVSSWVAGTVKPRYGTATDGTTVAANGTYSQYIVAPVNGDVRLVFSATANMKVTGVYARRVAKNYYFEAPTGKYWRLRGDMYHPAMLGAVVDGSTDDASAIRNADALAREDKAKLVVTGSIAVGSTVHITASSFDIAEITPLGSFAGESVVLFEEPGLSTQAGALIDGPGGQHFGRINVVGTTEIADQTTADTFIGIMIRNQNSTHANIVTDTTKIPIGCVITGVSEEFVVEHHADSCMRAMIFREEINRPVTTDVTPGVMHVILTASFCHQFFKAETVGGTSGFGGHIFLSCENNIDVTLPAVDILTPRGEYIFTGSLRSIWSTGIHIDQKFVSGAVTYDCCVSIDGMKLMASSAADSKPSLFVESCHVLCGNPMTVVAFGGGAIIAEITGTINLDYTCYRVTDRAGLTIGSSISPLTMGPGFIRYAVSRFDDASPALEIYPTTPIHPRDYLEVSMASDVSNQIVNIRDMKTYLRRINGHINWMGDTISQEVVLLSIERMDSKAFAFQISVDPLTTVDMSIPQSSLGVASGTISITERNGPLRANGFFLLGTATGNEFTKDAGSSNMDFSFGSGSLGSITSSHVAFKARSDVGKLSIRNGYTSVAKVFDIRINC